MWKHPRNIWIACTLLGAMVAIGFGWLTAQVLELDYQERLARLRADQDERVSLTLWRMDSMAMPIIAAEAARPHYVYQSVLQDPFGEHSAGLKSRLPSPLLNLPSEYVNLNFRLSPSGDLISPQLPPEKDWTWAASNGLSQRQLMVNNGNILQLSNSLNFNELFARLPSEPSNPHPSINFNGTGESTGNRLATAVVEPGSGADMASEIQQLVSPYGLPDEILDPKRAPESQQRADLDSADEQGEILQQTQQGRGSRFAQNDFASRSQRMQAVAQQAAVQQRNNYDNSFVVQRQEQPICEGVSRPLWVGDKLLLARRVEWDDHTSIQGCWLNWTALQRDLLGDVRDVLPEATLHPITEVTDAPPARALASIPVSLQLPDVAAPYWEWTPMTLAVCLAWGTLLAAAIGLGYLVFGVTSLSERRAAFVSAVTHELRTPLTTFQLYTEMLASGMIVEPTKRQEYLDTLQREAGRLGHLIDNVLAFARLERQPAPATREVVSSRELLHRMAGRLNDRAAQGGMTISGLPQQAADIAPPKNGITHALHTT